MDAAHVSRDLSDPEPRSPAVNKGGRPSKYTDEIVDSICLQLASGRSLRAICSASDMPSEDTVYTWLHKHPAFSEKYIRARAGQAEKYAAEIIDIADDASQDRVTRTREDGTEYEEVDHEHINRARLRVDSRKWIASKLLPKVYGDRTIIQDEREPDGVNAGALLAQLLAMEQSTGLLSRMGIKISQVTQSIELTPAPNNAIEATPIIGQVVSKSVDRDDDPVT